MNLKKFSSVLLAFLMLLSFIPLGTLIASADSITLDETVLSYTVSNGEATITECDSSVSGDVVLPSTLGGYPVTGIGDYLFDFNSNITSVTMPDGITHIGDYAFYNCSVTSINIPANVTHIGDAAFFGCNITDITLPDSVIYIGDSAFAGCSVTSINISANVTHIGYYAFNMCWDLKDITVDANNDVYSSENGVLFNKDKTKLICYPDGKTDTAYSIPNGVTHIGSSAFEFAGIRNISIPDSVTEIGSDAFSHCGINNIELPDNVKYIGSCAFYECPSLSSITIPDSVTYIGFSAFYGCWNLLTLTMGNSVAYIGDSAFEDTSIWEITLPDTVTHIGASAFDSTGYYNSSENWENDILYIGKHLIAANTSISGEYSIKNTTLTIADKAFYNCKSLTGISIPDSIKNIGVSAFDNTGYYNNSENWENGVLYIGKHLIKAKSTLTGDYAIKNETLSIADGAFSDCTDLKNISANGNNTVFISENGVLFNKTRTKLIYYPIGKTDTSYSIPNNVTSINSYAFYKCKNLTSITFPDTVTFIGDFAFSQCNNIDYIYYYGDSDMWKIIDKNRGNDLLSLATFQYLAPHIYDLNNDNDVNVKDLIRLKKVLAGSYTNNSVSTDIDNSGDTDSGDTLILRKYLLGILSDSK